VIHWPLHSGPYTENPSGDRQDPEGFFAYPPPLIYRLEFVERHREIGEDIEYNNRDEEILYHYF
jgi:hypothetical protein